MAAMLAALEEASRRQPTLVVIDDVHWADQASLHVLAMWAARRTRGQAAVLVTVRRPGDGANPPIDDLLADAGRRHGVHRLRLTGLGDTEITTIVERLAGGPAHASVTAAVVDRSDGNPFLAAELVRSFASEMPLGTEPSPSLLRRVPATVREAVARRLAHLPDITRELLRLAAVIGPVVERDVVRAASGLDVTDVVAALDVAVVSGMLRELDTPVGWTFTHSLVQDAVRADLSRGDRARLHGAIADALERDQPSPRGRHLDALAVHHVEAAVVRPADAAIGWSTRAALAARAEGGFDRAVRFWDGALRALTSSSEVEPRRRFDLLLELARDQRAMGDTAAFGHTIGQAFRVARRHGDRRGMASAAAELGWVSLWNTRPYGTIDAEVCEELAGLVEGEHDPHLASRLNGALAVELYYGDSDQRALAERLAGRAIDLARVVGDPVLLGRALNNYVLATWAPHRRTQRLAACDEALRHAGRGLPRHTEAIARLHRASLCLRRAEIDRVDADLSACSTIVSGAVVPEVAAQLTFAKAGMCMLRGQWSTARRLADDAYELHHRSGVWGADWARAVQLVCIGQAEGRVGAVAEDVVHIAENEINLPARSTAVLAVACAGDLREARRLARRWDWRDEPDDWSSDHRTADWAEAHALLHSPDLSELYERLLPYAGYLRVSGTAVTCRGSMHGVLATVAAALGDERAAAGHRAAAVAANRAAGADWWADHAASVTDA